jgi:hypothetical protein
MRLGPEGIQLIFRRVRVMSGPKQLKLGLQLWDV